MGGFNLMHAHSNHFNLHAFYSNKYKLYRCEGHVYSCSSTTCQCCSIFKLDQLRTATKSGVPTVFLSPASCCLCYQLGESVDHAQTTQLEEGEKKKQVPYNKLSSRHSTWALVAIRKECVGWFYTHALLCDMLGEYKSTGTDFTS